MRKKTSNEFGCILTHEQEEFINDGRPRDNALKIFRAKAYGNGGNKDGKRSESVNKIAKTIIDNGNLALQAKKHFDEYGSGEDVEIPLLGITNK